MSLFIRCITVMTVMLGMATMAVSAYAAKTEVAVVGVPLEADVPAVVLLEAEDLAGVPLEAEDLAGVPLEAAVAGAISAAPSATPSLYEGSGIETVTPVQKPLPIPDAAPNYAAPLDAPPLSSLSLSSRQNASFRVQVWPVLSLKPLPLQLPLPYPVPGGTGIPSDQLAAMQQESLATGIPWQIFAAIARIESDFGRNMSTSWAGAIGYGQFLPVTWADYGNGGDPYNFRDVIPAMGRYLLVAGVLNDPPRAIYAYNHSWSYVSQVLSYADTYGYQPTN